MKRFFSFLIAACAAFSVARAGVVAPVSEVSSADAAIDTMMNPLVCAQADSSLDTVLFDWALSPFPGICLITKPQLGFTVLIR